MEDTVSIFRPLPSGYSDDALMRLRCDSQSLNFYGDLSRYICKFLLAHETLSLLDVGPGTGSGLALLRLLHHPSAFTRLKFDPVVGIDIDPEFQRVAQQEFNDIRAMTGDVFDLADGSFDVVTCSHTIEHIPDPGPFVDKLARISRRALVIACPFEERDRIPGHCTSFDKSFFDSHGFDDVEVYDSNHWHNGLCCLAFKSTSK